MYNPFAIANFANAGNKKMPQSYWINSSGNDILMTLLDKYDNSAEEDLKALLNGKTISKKFSLELTYRDLDSTIDNIYSVMLSIGYLTAINVTQDEKNIYELKVPNGEVLNAYENIIDKYYTNDIKKEEFYHYLFITLLNENGFYAKHELLAGLGYLDIYYRNAYYKSEGVLEIKVCENNESLDQAIANAIKQIENNNYEEIFETGLKNKAIYAIAIKKRMCKIVQWKKL